MHNTVHRYNEKCSMLQNCSLLDSYRTCHKSNINLMLHNLFNANHQYIDFYFKMLRR